MHLITLPNELLEKARRFAEDYYDLHYKRMYSDKENRIDKVYVGKLGEEAVGRFLEVKPSYDVGTDPGYDLQYDNVKVAVKTKRVPVNLIYSKEERGVLIETRPNLSEEWWIHIPCDQYPKVKLNSEFLFGCLCNPPNVWIVGWLTMTEVDKVKEYHRVGQQLTPSFKLPPPDSYGIEISYFKESITFPPLKASLKKPSPLHKFM